MDTATIDKEVQRTIRGFRVVGWGFVIVGSVMLALFVSAALDPTASITVNGIPTRDPATKMTVAVFVGMFPVIGALLALLPTRVLTPLVRSQFQWVSEIMKSMRLK